MSRLRTDCADDKVIMLRRTEAAKPNAIKAQATMASIMLKPWIEWVWCNGFNGTVKFNTLHFSRSPPRVVRAQVRCLAATVWGRTLCQWP